MTNANTPSVVEEPSHQYLVIHEIRRDDEEKVLRYRYMLFKTEDECLTCILNHRVVQYDILGENLYDFNIDEIDPYFIKYNNIFKNYIEFGYKNGYRLKVWEWKRRNSYDDFSIVKIDPKSSFCRSEDEDEENSIWFRDSQSITFKKMKRLYNEAKQLESPSDD